MWRKVLGSAAVAFAVASSMTAHASDAAPEVVVSLKPLHSLVAGTMDGVGTPQLLVTGAASPHTYQMRFSDAQALDNADLVVWIGENLETFLSRPIQNLGADAKVVTLHEVPGMRLLRNREGGLWEHEEEEDGHEDELVEEDGHEEEHQEELAEEHGHEEEEDGHDEELAEEDGHEEEHEDGHEEELAEMDEHDEDEDVHVDEHAGHGHAHTEFDMHVWLDPGNSERIVDVVEEALVAVDPANAAAYRRNADAMRQRISGHVADIRERLEPLHDRSFIVFHDGYQYFERAFALSGAGSITVDPARPPGARRLAELREALAERHVVCVFSEPQFEPDLVRTVTEGLGVRTAALDPLGVGIDPGPDAWFEIMDDLASAFEDCLGDG